MSGLSRCLTWEPEPAIQPLSDQSTSRPIEGLHDDVLLYIFKIYLETQRSIMKLLLTCSRWHDIVVRHPSLRSHIHYWQPAFLSNLKRVVTQLGYGYDSIYPHDLGLACTTPEQLSQAIERLKGVPFKITFHGYIMPYGIDDTSWGSLPWQVFSTQCTGISIFYGGVGLPFWENLPVMSNIKSIIGVPFTKPHLGLIFSKVPKQTISPLQSLYISAPGDFDPNLFPNIMAGIKTFEITEERLHLFTLDQCRRLFSSFRALQHLKCKGARKDANDLRELVPWDFKLTTLTVTGLFPSLFPASVLETLVELTIDFQQVLPIEDYEALVPSDENKDKNIITLPALRHLNLVGSWIDLLRIDAPSLQVLVLSGGKVTPTKDVLPYLVHTGLRPSAVHIVDPTRQVVILDGLLRGPFSEVIELKIHVSVDWVKAGHLGQFLAVRKKKGQPEIVSNLRHLVVSVFSSVPSDRRPVEKAAKEATRLRIESGTLLSVRCLGEEVNFKLPAR